MLGYPLTLTSFFAVYFFTAIFYFTGKLLLGFLKVQVGCFWQDTFFSSALGCILWVGGFAVFTTGGITVFSPLLVIIALVLFKFQRQEKLTYPSPKFNLSYGLILGSLIAGNHFWFWRYIHDWSQPFLDAFLVPKVDLAAYSKNILVLLKGYEVNPGVYNGYLMGYIDSGVTPYHYFDLWLAAFTTHFSGLPTLLTVELVSGSILLTLTGLGIAAVWESLGIKNLSLIAFALASVHFSGWFIGLVKGALEKIEMTFLGKEIPYLFNDFFNSYTETNVSVFTKIAPLYWVFCGIFLCLKAQKPQWAIVLCSLIPALYTPVSAAFIGGLGIWIAFELWLKKKWYQEVWLVIIAVILVVGFYAFFGSNNSVSANAHTKSFSKLIFNTEQVIQGLEFVLKCLLPMFQAYLFVFIGAIILYRRSPTEANILAKRWFSLPFYIMIAGAVSALLMDRTVVFDYFQLFLNVALPAFKLIALVFIALIILYLPKASVFGRTINLLPFYGVLLVSGLIISFLTSARNSHHTTTYKVDFELLNKFEQHLVKHPNLNKNGAYLTDHHWNFVDNPALERTGLFLGYLDKDFWQTSLSSRDSVPDNMYFRTILLNTPFSLFVSEQQDKGLLTSLKQAKFDFIRKHKIEYLFVKHTLPADSLNLWLPYASEVWIDKNYKDHYLILDTSKIYPLGRIIPVERKTK